MDIKNMGLFFFFLIEELLWNLYPYKDKYGNFNRRFYSTGQWKFIEQKKSWKNQWINWSAKIHSATSHIDQAFSCFQGLLSITLILAKNVLLFFFLISERSSFSNAVWNSGLSQWGIGTAEDERAEGCEPSISGLKYKGLWWNKFLQKHLVEN